MTYTDEELLDALREYADERGEPPTSTEANDTEGMASAVTYHHRFGSWNRALEMAGFEPHKPTLSDEDLLDMLREFADEHGRPPTQADAGTEQGLPSKSAFRNHFGSWTAALDAAGLASGRSQKKLHSDDEKSSQHHANP